MRLRSFSFDGALSAVLVPFVATFVAFSTARAQATDPMADGLMPSDYVRASGGLVAPFSGMRYWKSGIGANLMWENWQQGGSGVGRVGFGLGIGYSWLPFNASEFTQKFTPAAGSVTSASAAKGTILEISSLVRIRIPAPYIMPTVNIGLGFINWAPGEISYTTTAAGTVTTSATQQHRSGAEVSMGGGLDKNLFDRYAIFAEAMWAYGFTSYASGFATPNSSCAGGCDNERNASFGTVRGGLRVRLGR
jgi:hypothetical protein